jgi:multidrug efflux pump
MVVSIVIFIAGVASVITLPIAQYPPIVPPTVQVTASYPGASAQTLADTVGQPIEEQVNGVEGMIYMSSTCSNNGVPNYSLTVSFAVGTDIHTALMLVQVRTQLAMPQLPEIVQKQGVNVQMKSPNILQTVNLVSPDGRYDSLYLSNYAQINLFDDLSRLPGVGLVTFLGQREYSIRAWIDPQKLASLSLTASDVVQAIREQNVDVAAGNIGQQPVPKGQNYQLVLNTLGRLTTPESSAASSSRWARTAASSTSATWPSSNWAHKTRTSIVSSRRSRTARWCVIRPWPWQFTRSRRPTPSTWPPRLRRKWRS